MNLIEMVARLSEQYIDPFTLVSNRSCCIRMLILMLVEEIILHYLGKIALSDDKPEPTSRKPSVNL